MSRRTRGMVVGAVFALLVAGGVVETHTLPAARRDLAAAEMGAARAGHLRARAKQDRDAAAGRLAAATTNGETVGGSTTEALAEDLADPATLSSREQWLRRVKQLKHAVLDDPAQFIPELERLRDQDWLILTIDAKLDGEADLRRACAAARNQAKESFIQMLSEALESYLGKHHGQMPSDTLDLLSEFPLEPYDYSAMLARYKVAPPTAKTAGRDPVLIEEDKAVIDRIYDERQSITRLRNGEFGFGSEGGDIDERDPTAAKAAEIEAASNHAVEAFRAANNGLLPQHPAQLLPYLKRDNLPVEFVDRLSQPFTPGQLTQFQDEMKKWAEKGKR
jgi:hypothetical protein